MSHLFGLGPDALEALPYSMWLQYRRWTDEYVKARQK